MNYDLIGVQSSTYYIYDEVLHGECRFSKADIELMKLFGISFTKNLLKESAKQTFIYGVSVRMRPDKVVTYLDVYREVHLSDFAVGLAPFSVVGGGTLVLDNAITYIDIMAFRNQDCGICVDICNCTGAVRHQAYLALLSADSLSVRDYDNNELYFIEHSLLLWNVTEFVNKYASELVDLWRNEMLSLSHCGVSDWDLNFDISKMSFSDIRVQVFLKEVVPSRVGVPLVYRFMVGFLINRGASHIVYDSLMRFLFNRRI